jgi:UDP:flavonoid glycosyltransferase YjiC (YdhE family)
LLWRLIDAVANHYWGGGINEARRAVGLPPLSRRLITDGFFAPRLNLVEVSRHLVPAPPDWTPRHQLTGSWFLEEPDWDWSPPPELEEFLSADPRPIAVYLGFGDTIEGNRPELLHILRQAIQQSGARAVVQTKVDEADQCSGAGSSVLYLASPVPHTWLLPRVAAMVHHGGAGVTHYTARAGIPSIIVPYVADQFYWGATMARLGVAPRPIPRSGLTAASLVQAIQVATADSGLRHRAALLGALVRDEDGTANAVRLLEQFARG